MSSPSLSDSPGIFKVGCNVAGAILENRPKVKFLQNSSDFFSSFIYFYVPSNLLNQRSATVGFYFVLGSRTTKEVSKRSEDTKQNGRQNPAIGVVPGKFIINFVVLCIIVSYVTVWFWFMLLEGSLCIFIYDMHTHVLLFCSFLLFFLFFSILVNV